MGVYVAKKNKYSDFGFKLQVIEELICRMGVCATYDKKLLCRTHIHELICRIEI